MTGQVQGKVAIVTGGASGIGEACSELLAREGASVAVTDIDELRGPEVVARIKKAGGEAMFLHHDVTSEPRWIEVVAEVMKRYGGLDRAVDHGDVAGGLAAANRDQSRRRIPVGEALPAGDAQNTGWLRDHDVVAGRLARLGLSFRLLRHKRRRPAVCQGNRNGMRDLQ